MTSRWHVSKRMLPEMRFLRMFYKSWTLLLQALGVLRVQIRFCWQWHGIMISQLVRSEGISFCVDPRIAKIQEIGCTNRHLAAKVDENLVKICKNITKMYENLRKYCENLAKICENRTKIYENLWISYENVAKILRKSAKILQKYCANLEKKKNKK